MRRRRKNSLHLLLSSMSSLILILTVFLLAFYVYSHWFKDQPSTEGELKKATYEQPVVASSEVTIDEVEEGNLNNQTNNQENMKEIVPSQQQANMEETVVNICPPFVSKNLETVLSENDIPKYLKIVSSPTAYEIKKGTSEISEEANQILLEETMLVADAADALDNLIAAAKEEGIELYAYSGYRSYTTQEHVFQRNVNRLGKEQAERVSAVPGHSEHQTGLAMDITSKALIDIYRKDRTISPLQQKLGVQEEGIWLQQNAHRFGFTMSYPEGKEEITGYKYEPWHFYYVGDTLAKTLYETKQVFSEYAIENCL